MQTEKKHVQCAEVLGRILDAREARAARQRLFLDEFQTTLICFTLNIAGPRKTDPLAERAFFEGKRRILRELERAGITAIKYEETKDGAGFSGYWAVEANPERVKHVMAAIETSDPLGRLYDIDVLRPNGRKISRQDIGLPGRACLICGKPATVCSRSAAHPNEEVVRRTEELLRDYFYGQYADRVAQAAARAMLYEVSVTPKPGLVSREGSGAHRDMNFFTFIDSAAALTPWFRTFVLNALRFRGCPKELFRASRLIGLEAEDTMYRATDGINTHKGLIFSFGVLCASMGYLQGRGLPETLDSVLSLSAEMAAEAYNELGEESSAGEPTHGEKTYEKYGLPGARGEAAAGFPTAAGFALPQIGRAHV